MKLSLWVPNLSEFGWCGYHASVLWANLTFLPRRLGFQFGSLGLIWLVGSGADFFLLDKTPILNRFFFVFLLLDILPLITEGVKTALCDLIPVDF